MITPRSKRIAIEDVIQRRLVAQSRSFDLEVMSLAKTHEARLQSIPAIQPIRNDDLKRMASGWGWRYHPIYKVRNSTTEWISAETGTEIFATGDGEVVKVRIVQWIRKTYCD